MYQYVIFNIISVPILACCCIPLYQICMTCLATFTNVCYELDIEVSHDDITSGIKGLANNKSCGLDGVSAEHRSIGPKSLQ